MNAMLWPMQVTWAHDEDRGELAVAVVFESPEELRRAWEHHLVSRQMVVHRDAEQEPAAGSMVTVHLTIAPGTTITVEGVLLRHRRRATGGMDWLLSLEGLSREALESIRQNAGVAAQPDHLHASAPLPPEPQALEALIASWRKQNSPDIVELLSRLQSAELRSHLAMLTAVVKALIARGDIAEAARLLEACGRYAERSAAARAVVAMALEECVDGLAADDLRDMALLSPYEERIRYVRALAAIGPAVSGHLLEVLRRADDRPSRDVVVEALQRFGAPAHRLIIEELHKKHLSLEWYFLRNLILLAGRLRLMDALHDVRRALENSHPTVRSEALRTLVILEGKDAAGAITAGLTDADPRVVKTSVRLFATMHMLTDTARAYFLRMLDRAGVDEDDVEHDLLIEILRVISGFEGQNAWEKPLLNLLDVVPGPSVADRLLRRHDKRPIGAIVALANALGATGGIKSLGFIMARLIWEIDPAARRALRAAMDRIARRRAGLPL